MATRAIGPEPARLSELKTAPFIHERDLTAMFSHITLGCSDIVRAAAFYDAILAPLGLRRRAILSDGGPPAACWVGVPTLPRFYVYIPFDGEPASVGNGTMVAFLAPSADAVDQAYAQGLEHGGCDEGPPGPRPHYGEGYYGAYLRDPDGNKLHIVLRADLAQPFQRA